MTKSKQVFYFIILDDPVQTDVCELCVDLWDKIYQISTKSSKQ